MTKDITPNITIGETFFTEWKSMWRQFEILPFILIERSRVLMGWLCFTIDIHHKDEDYEP